MVPRPACFVVQQNSVSFLIHVQTPIVQLQELHGNFFNLGLFFLLHHHMGHMLMSFQIWIPQPCKLNGSKICQLSGCALRTAFPNFPIPITASPWPGCGLTSSLDSVWLIKNLFQITSYFFHFFYFGLKLYYMLISPVLRKSFLPGKNWGEETSSEDLECLLPISFSCCNKSIYLIQRTTKIIPDPVQPAPKSHLYFCSCHTKAILSGQSSSHSILTDSQPSFCCHSIYLR